MRRVLLSGIAVAVLVFAIGCTAEAPPPPTSTDVPLTITMPVGTAGNDAVGRVDFPAYPRANGQPFSRGTERTQYLVGKIPKASDGRYRFDIETFKGASPNGTTQTVSFGADAVCTPEDKGQIARIACAASAPGGSNVQGPYGLVCSAIYEYAGDPPGECTGTYACKKCPGGVRVCAEVPECN